MPELRFVDANGLRFAYLEEGSGPLVLLLHGFPDTAHTWDHVRPRIAARGYRAVTPFMRGYHPTQIPERDTDAKTMAEDPLALIEALGEKSAVLVGHDWGASAAYGAAALMPERVSKLFTVAIPHPASIRPTPRMAWGVRHFFAYKLPGAPARFARDDFAALRAIYKRWSPVWTPDEAEFAAVKECFAHPGSLDAALGYYRALSFRPADFLKKRIEASTVSFAGLHDALMTPADHLRATRWFTGPYFVEALPGGHFLHREHPGAFADKLLSYL